MRRKKLRPSILKGLGRHRGPKDEELDEVTVCHTGGKWADSRGIAHLIEDRGAELEEEKTHQEPKERLRRLSKFFPSGSIAFQSPLHYPSLFSLFSPPSLSDQNPLIVTLIRSKLFSYVAIVYIKSGFLSVCFQNRT